MQQEPPTNRRAVGLDFTAIGGKIQRHGSALIGAGETGCKAPGLKTPNREFNNILANINYLFSQA